ncbi:MAG: protein-L-isoaspartate O-methyltransferase [Rhodospirillales bacterium RIFCSPLOWO2_12_FULL_58_28]|nr:MAG: protein-L-isoaspartate O-methyltransferase [Rhodospirillales bacterium RIFCSPLOWO2_02_FULL_58_16]OHC77928.1 MAG: protein-L-isoaspartate O-methyltransferase [Rhodospirillales bacterium RIFCSPLOWO2_12_FULL_58_28]
MNYADARMRMVKNQIRANKVTDLPVLSAMAEIPREAFVPAAMKGVAYVDEAVPLGGGRYLMEPMVSARLLEALKVQPDDVVLEIGCGAGYVTALLARMASTVVALESDKALAAEAVATLGGLEINNVAVVSGKLEKGYPKQAPYDIIFINGAVGSIPAGIIKQLAEGGRLATMISGAALGKGVLVTRHATGVSRRDLFDAGTPILSGFADKPAFAL